MSFLIEFIKGLHGPRVYWGYLTPFSEGRFYDLPHFKIQEIFCNWGHSQYTHTNGRKRGGVEITNESSVYEEGVANPENLSTLNGKGLKNKIW